tara:strand:+ start:2335 stop:2607 length:273 start_codon:yes stop_codon:yes gene_type:complete
MSTASSGLSSLSTFVPLSGGKNNEYLIMLVKILVGVLVGFAACEGLKTLMGGSISNELGKVTGGTVGMNDNHICMMMMGAGAVVAYTVCC